jgi:hypothetical protein
VILFFLLNIGVNLTIKDNSYTIHFIIPSNVNSLPMQLTQKNLNIVLIEEEVGSGGD